MRKIDPSLKCPVCGKGGLRTKQKYCSQSCNGTAKRNRVEKTCPQCSGTFTVEAHRASIKRFCKVQCRMAFYDTRPSRVCPTCKTNKPSLEFRASRGGVCRNCESEKGKRYDRTEIGRWKRASGIARRRGHEWTIGLEEYVKLVSLPCHYCYRPISETGSGLDRKDNERGYLLDNVVTCCCRCNRVKMDHFTYRQMTRLSEVIRQLDLEVSNTA
jgi:predicted nucleic acid-binding Zn ribbon protein